jgi:hypothetical protein
VQVSKGSKGGIGFLSAVSIGVGGMIGGGIFAVLGLAVQLAKGGTPVAFAVAGLIALLTSYSYARLSLAYPSQGGTVEFLNQAFGVGLTTGSLNILLWLSYIIMLSLYAYAFGSYGASFFNHNPLWKHILTTLIVLLLMSLNLMGSAVVGKAEEWIVGFKVAILLLFVVAGLWSVDAERLHPSNWSPPVQLIAGGMIIFLAYEGFELIANTAEDVKDPEKLPLAYYTSVGFVIVVYVLVALVTVGNLPYNQIVAAEDYALAASARPFLGTAGFTLIAIAALLSTSSAINATLYGAAKISFIIAKEGELPEELEREVWNRPVEGLIITALAVLLVANLFDLSSISTMGSAGFLIIFAAVNLANARLHDVTKSRKWISVTGAVLCFLALAILVLQTSIEAPLKTGILAGLIGISVGIEYIYRRMTNRVLKPLCEHPRAVKR